jgi:hypothetical protein
MGGADTSPTLADCLWFNALHSELFAEQYRFPIEGDDFYCPTDATSTGFPWSAWALTYRSSGKNRYVGEKVTTLTLALEELHIPALLRPVKEHQALDRLVWTQSRPWPILTLQRRGKFSTDRIKLGPFNFQYRVKLEVYSLAFPLYMSRWACMLATAHLMMCTMFQNLVAKLLSNS